jgi:rhodanese-related sulfurtransferase
LLLIIPLLIISSCKKEEKPPTPPPPPPGAESKYDVLTAHLVDIDMDLPVVLNDYIISAPQLNGLDAFISSHDFIDIRSTVDYQNGHIESAVNIELKDVLTHAETTVNPIIVLSYTGQSAAYAVVALRLSGYPDAKVLKWGMSGWRSDYAGPWENHSGINGNVAIGNQNWVKESEPALAEFGEPDIESDATDGAPILKDRILKMLNAGPKGIVNHSVLNNPDNYFINNFWDAVDYDNYGSIGGAYRIKPLSITNGLMKHYDPNKTAVTYCWTGQTSSMVTAYMNILGFNAVSLSYGANGMIYSELDEAHQFIASTIDRPVVIGPNPTENY